MRLRALTAAFVVGGDADLRREATRIVELKDAEAQAEARNQRIAACMATLQLAREDRR